MSGTFFTRALLLEGACTMKAGRVLPKPRHALGTGTKLAVWSEHHSRQAVLKVADHHQVGM